MARTVRADPKGTAAVMARTVREETVAATVRVVREETAAMARMARAVQGETAAHADQCAAFV